MMYSCYADIIPLFKYLVQGLQPFARSNFVHLEFKSDFEIIEVNYYPEQIIPGLIQLLCRIIAFTPQEYQVELLVPQKQEFESGFIQIRIENNGPNLSYLGETLTDGIDFMLDVEPLRTTGTRFKLVIPIHEGNANKELWKSDLGRNTRAHYNTPFFKQLQTHLKAHFNNIHYLEKKVIQRDHRAGNFLKKVHMIILANLENENFDQQALCNAMALSRSQLYRKLKPLVDQSPAQYIKGLRLEKAKELLCNSDLTVSEICIKMGFVNFSHFSRAFKSKFRITPSEYRNKRKMSAENDWNLN